VQGKRPLDVLGSLGALRGFCERLDEDFDKSIRNRRPIFSSFRSRATQPQKQLTGRAPCQREGSAPLFRRQLRSRKHPADCTACHVPWRPLGVGMPLLRDLTATSRDCLQLANDWSIVSSLVRSRLAMMSRPKGPGCIGELRAPKLTAVAVKAAMRGWWAAALA
jgi:hypothetical protein